MDNSEKIMELCQRIEFLESRKHLLEKGIETDIDQHLQRLRNRKKFLENEGSELIRLLLQNKIRQ